MEKEYYYITELYTRDYEDHVYTEWIFLIVNPSIYW